MSTWKQMISDAKELLDIGAITQEEFEETKREAFALRRQNMQATPSINEDDLSGETQMFTGVDTVEDELSSDTLAGTTQLVPEVEIDDMSSDPLSSDTLAGGTEFVPDYDMDARRNDTLSGVTMMGRAVTLTDANIETLSSGTLFNNRYSIIKLLGKGGMGVVYKAVDIHTGADLALKVLRNYVKNDAVYIQSLKDEVALGHRWNNANFLQIRHLDVESVQPFVVMELMDRDAKEWLDSHGGQVASKDVLSVIQSIASALTVMHEDGYIHLDLKPENVLLKDGKAKLADFGISSSLKKQRGGHSGSGTLFYAPPEQMDGGQCDVRTDIYALGMMTGQLLSGRFPFALKKAEEVQQWHRSGSRDFAYLPGKVAQVLAKACAVSMDERYRTVNEFIGELEKALDHKPWYPPSLPLESVHPSLVLVNGKEHTTDVAKLLPQGVLTPSLTLKGGKVLMQSNPFALSEVGMFDYLSSSLKLVVADILRGSDDKLSRLSKQDSITESHLAMMAKRFELPNRTVQKRLYYASNDLDDLEEYLTLAYTYRTAMRDIKSANDLMEYVEGETISERLEVARYQRWLELDEQGVQRTMFAIEEDCETSEDWQSLACASISLFWDWGGADTSLLKCLPESKSPLATHLQQIKTLLFVFGLSEFLKGCVEPLLDKGKTSFDYGVIADFWSDLGFTKYAFDAEAMRQKVWMQRVDMVQAQLQQLGIEIKSSKEVLNERKCLTLESFLKKQQSHHQKIARLKKRLTMIDSKLPTPKGKLNAKMVQSFEKQVERIEEQTMLGQQVDTIYEGLLKIGVELRPPSGVLTPLQVSQYQEQLKKQQVLHQQIVEMEPVAKHLKLDAAKWVRPYTEQQVKQRREEIAEYSEYSEQMKVMLAEANKLGWKTSNRGRIDADTVRTFAKQLAEQQQLSTQLGKLRAEAEALGGTLVLPKYPLTPQKIAGIEAQMPSVRVESDVREQVSLAKSIGWDLEMPKPPYTLDLVENLREQVQEQERCKVACKNPWGLKHPSFPMTPEEQESFQTLVLRQAAWHDEIEVLYNRAQTPNRPNPPYTLLGVKSYQQATNVIVSHRRIRRLVVIAICILSGMLTFQWNTARKFKYNLNMMGCYPELPMFGHAELYRLQFSLYSQNYSTQCRSFDFERFLELQPLLTVKQIPSGTLTMSCTTEKGSDCNGNEIPTRQVTVDKDFYMMETEITQHLYEVVTGQNPSYFEGSKRPVEMVSWFDAIEFANRLSKLDGRSVCYSHTYPKNKYNSVKLLENCTGWRLPTNDEWEYAARGGQYYKYAGSSNVDNVAWYAGNSGETTRPVGQKKPNGFGLYDMTGNVWEWDSSFGIRGGGFLSDVNDTLLSYQWSRAPLDQKRFLGFRLVRSDYKQAPPTSSTQKTTPPQKNPTMNRSINQQHQGGRGNYSNRPNNGPNNRRQK